MKVDNLCRVSDAVHSSHPEWADCHWEADGNWWQVIVVDGTAYTFAGFQFQLVEELES